MRNIAAVVLAGGKGTRMNSELPKVLRKIGGEPMIYRTLDKLNSLDFSFIGVVVGFKGNEVKKAIDGKYDCEFAIQDIPLGTGHALHCAVDQIKRDFDYILVVNGDDSAFYDPKTLKSFIDSHVESGAVASLMTLQINTDSQLGRVIRDQDSQFLQIMESGEYRESGLVSNEINCGAYIFEKGWLMKNINNLPLHEKGEYYITDLVHLAKAKGERINLFKLEDESEWIGVNTPEELEYANSKFKLS